jgi:hypothetical protein
MKALLSIFSFAAVVATTAWAQSSYTAAVRGTVSDPSGGAVPGAKVTITEADRNIAHPTTTDGAGRYVLIALPPGVYTLAVEALGFEKFVQTNIPLAVQQQATFDITLRVGNITTAVEVTSEAPLLNTTIATLGQVVDNRYMLSLPNLGRNPLSMMSLTPGVVGVAGATSPGTSTNFVANGARNATSDVLVDGALVNTTEQNSGVTDLKWTPSVDAVQEFKVQTNFFQAEYAQSGGAIVNMVTRSGTNEFHGTAYDFRRDSTLNANSWSNNRVGARKTYYRQDQPGAVLGGPIKKNKTFFFVNYEYTASKNPTSSSLTVPTLNERNGDFSKTLFSDGKLITIYNPADTYKDSTGAVKRNPFPGNTIPSSLWDPVAVKAMKYLPLPNALPTNLITNANNWYEAGINRSKSQQVGFKVDHSFADSLRFSGRYNYAPSSTTYANLFGQADADLAAADPRTPKIENKTQSATGSLTWMSSPTTIWVLNYGFIYQNYQQPPRDGGFDLTTLGLPKYMYDNASYHVFPYFQPGGYASFGAPGATIIDRQEGVHQVSASVTKVARGHNIKAGVEMRRNLLDYAQPGNPSGGFTFNAQTTSQDLNVGNSYQGNGFASMLLGWGGGQSEFSIDPKVFSRAGYWGFFLQDDWKVTPRLTINLGLRYEFEVPRRDREYRESYWDLNAPVPISVPGYNLKGVFAFCDKSHPSPYDADYNNLGPRLGFAYAIDNKTSIRAGGGIFYTVSHATVNGHTGYGFKNPSYITWTLDSGATRYATLDDPYPNGLNLPIGRSKGSSSFLGLGATTVVPANLNPQMYSWNVSIEREVSWNSKLQISYAGSRGLHLYLPYNSLTPLNPIYWGLGRTALQARVPNPFFGSITDPTAVNLNGPTIQYYRLLRPMPQFDGASGLEGPNTADSIYHSMQIVWEKRFSKGLSASANYTWSKSIDDSSVTGQYTLAWMGGSPAMQNPLNLNLERSLSGNDVPHRFVASGVWDLPFGHGKSFGTNVNRIVDGFLGGWEISGILTLQSGPPLQVSQSGGTLWNGTQRPNLIGDPATSGSIYDRMNNYFNVAAFSKPEPDTFGTAPRYLNMRGPAVNTLDAALLKNWKTTEKQSLQFRLDATNVRNHPVFSNPGTSFGSSSFGQITGTKVGSRNVQLGLKYFF